MRTLALTLLLSLGVSCHAEGWTFAVTRAAWSDAEVGASLGESEQAAEMVVLFYLCLPLCIDLALFPVAFPRDLIVLGIP